MMKFVAVFVILLGVISASELSKEDIGKNTEKWATLKKEECDYLHITSHIDEFFKLDTVVDARPDGYRAKIRFTVVGEKEAWIFLSKDAKGDTGYLTVLGWGFFNTTVLQRGNVLINRTIVMEVQRSGVISTEVPTDVVIAITNDGVVTVTVEDNTIITYNDPEPIEVNYLGFGTFYGDVQYYYNCTKSTNGDAMPSHAKK